MVCTLLAGVNVVAFAADSDESLTDTVSVLRAYNPNNGEHLMTVDETEYNANVARGYSGEGEAWVAPLHSNTEVWRAYNPNSGEHMLAPEAEVKALEAAGWQNEGLKMYSCEDEENVPIYRVFNPNATDAGSHHYCGEEEAAGLVALGWQWDNNGEPVIYGCLEEPPVILVGLTDADQISANSIMVEFDQAATGLVEKDDIDVVAADGTLTIPVNKMTLSDDGMTATLDLAVALSDQKDYVVTLNDSMVTFTASVGEVATIAIKTASATQNVATPIEFALFDSMGVDVTNTVNLDAFCGVEVEGGSDVTSDTNYASKSTITMGTVGDVATVTVTYNSGDLDAEDVTAKGVITCIEPEATVGTPAYYDVPFGKEASLINNRSGCSKFYWGLIQATPVTVEENKQNDNVFFTAVDDELNPIEYDTYTVESSNDDVFSVTSDTDTGKYVKMSVVGNTVGTANIVITATKNGKDTPYTIPVTVTTEGKLSSVKVVASRSTMSNAYDLAYEGTLAVTAYDNNGNVIAATSSFDLANKDTKGDTHHAVAGLTNTVIPEDKIGFRVDGDGSYTAYGDQGGTQTIKIETSKDDVVVNKTQNIKVTPIAEAIWNDGVQGSDANLTYSVELGKSTIDPSDTSQGSTTARLVANYGGKFVGYVNDNNGTVGSHVTPASGSAINVSATTKLSNIKYGVKYGAKYSVTGNLYNSAVNITPNGDPTGNFTGSVDINTLNKPVAIKQVTPAVAGGDGKDHITAYLDATKSDYDFWFAKPGAYTVVFAYKMNGKDATSTSSLKVTNGFTAMNPKVTVSKRVVDDLSVATITEALSTMVDMNNANSNHESIVNLLGARTDVAAVGDLTDFTQFANLPQDNSRVTVKYAVVEDNVGELKGFPVYIQFLVPINSTFRTE